MKNRRMPIRFSKNKPLFFGVIFTIFCLVTLAGLMMVITNISVIIESFSYLQKLYPTDTNVVNEVIRNSMVAIFIIIILTLLVMFVYLKRTIDPLYKLKRHLEKMAEGDFEHEFTLRSDDQFKDIGQVINLLRENVASKIRESGAKTDHIFGLVENLNEKLSHQKVHKELSPDLAGLLEEIRKNLMELRAFFSLQK